MTGGQLRRATRANDWQSRLAAVMLARQATPFAWGTNDCATFAADCVLATTGVDRIGDLRTRWRDERQALRVLIELGGLSAAVSDRLGPPISTPALAQPGDVGILMQGGREAMCVCGGAHWHMPAEHGLVTLAADQVITAWRCEAV